MYTYDSKYKIFTWLKRIPETSTQVDDVKHEIKEIKSILKTSNNKVNKVKISIPCVPTIPTQRYLTFPNEKLFKIAKKNIQDVNKFINKHKLNNSFLHFSINKIDKLEQIIPTAKNNKKKSLYYNPDGLWLSHGSSWLDFVDSNIKIPNNSNLFAYIYKIEVFDTVKLITNKDDLHKFIKLYKKKPADIKLYDVIDWDRVRKDFNGLIITPWLGDKIWHLGPERMEIIGGEVAHDFFVDLMGSRWKNNMILLSEWYRHWECASGVIWNINGIASCDLIKETDFSKYI